MSNPSGPAKDFHCPHCGMDVVVEASEVIEGVISWPPLYCAFCPTHPLMMSNNHRETEVAHAG